MWLLLVITCVVAFLFYLWLDKVGVCGGSNLAPGPLGLPFLGYSLGARPLETLERLAKDYGPVARFQVLGKEYVHLGSYSVIREAYMKTGEAFTGRPHSRTALRWLLDGRGISEDEGQEWTEHRRFVLHTLRDFSFGHLDVSDRVQEAAEQLVDDVKKYRGRTFDPLPLLRSAAVSVLAGLLFDRARMPEGDEEFDAVLELVTTASEQVFNCLPQLWRDVVPLEMRPGFSELRRVKQQLHELLNQVIREHEQSFNDSLLRDYLDVYLDERRRAKEEGSLDTSTFTVDHLKTICIDLLVCGSESVALWLHWALRIVAEQPQVQRRIQEEMDSLAFAEDKLDSVTIRENLPYTEATILEIHRYASVYALALFRTNPEETTLCGFRIPAQSNIVANLQLAHRDPEYWENPDVFDPSRFLGDDGRPEKRDGFIPFSAGKRMCLGESLTKTEAFIFLTTLLKKFTFELCRISTDDMVPLAGDSILRSAGRYKLLATPRMQTTTL